MSKKDQFYARTIARVHDKRTYPPLIGQRIPKFRNLTVIYPRNEIDLAAFFHWRLSRLPMLVIDAAQQFWELCAKFGCFLDLQPVTNVRSSR